MCLQSYFACALSISLIDMISAWMCASASSELASLRMRCALLISVATKPTIASVVARRDSSRRLLARLPCASARLLSSSARLLSSSARDFHLVARILMRSNAFAIASRRARSSSATSSRKLVSPELSGPEGLRVARTRGRGRGAVVPRSCAVAGFVARRLQGDIIICWR